MQKILLILLLLMMPCSTGNAQENATYDMAKQTGQYYTCSFTVPSFFGEVNQIEAIVQGDNEKGTAPKRDRSNK